MIPVSPLPTRAAGGGRSTGSSDRPLRSAMPHDLTPAARRTFLRWIEVCTALAAEQRRSA